MADIDSVLRTIETIRSHCNELDSLHQRQTAEYSKEDADLKKMAQDLDNQMAQNLESYKQAHLGKINNQIADLIALLRKDYPREFNQATEHSSLYAGQDEETNRQCLYRLVEDLNKAVAELNAVDFDQLVPPIRINITNEVFTVSNGIKTEKYDYLTKPRVPADDPKPLSEQAKKIYSLCKDTLNCVAALMKAVDANLDAAGFSAHVQACNSKRLQEMADSHERVYNELYDALFVDEALQAVPKHFFTELAESGKVNEVDPTGIPDTYKESMTIGDLRLLVDGDDKHKAYFRNSPILRKYMADGYLSAPFIMNMAKRGNLLLNINEDIYSEQTCAFVNQMIMQFLLCYPANRINFCLVDVEDLMKFSKFNKLTKISNNILMNGIVRDDRQLENTIKDMEQLMYKIDDDILSYNNMPNIFEYNKEYKANPQNVHLFVLVNYPSGMREDIAKRISKILQGGNKAGIFTIIINNKQAALSPNFKSADNEHLLETARKHSLVINKTATGFELDIPQKNQFVPRATIPVESLQDVIDRLKVEGAQKQATVIPLDSMFAETDKFEAAGINVADESKKVLDIPIGARGGEVQNFLLKTTGDGSAHAVVIGGTGSGKSNLLHTIILSACYKYSPEDLNLYIVDFKGGVEFEYYEANKIREKQIPHIKLTGLTSDLEDGVSILSNLHKELRRREEEFKRVRVEDIDQYKRDGRKLPRLLVIIDEIQELFEQDERLGQKAIDILRELFKKGRAFGISILWASQNVPKVPGLKDKILSQIGNRISLRLNEPDDAIDIKIDPKAVKNLNRPEKGLGVINDIRYGNDSVEFRVAFAESSAKRTKYSEKIIEKWRSVTESMPSAPLYIVGDDAEPSPMGENTIYASIPTKEDVVSKAFENYTLQLGQDYVTGKPFDLQLPLMENKQNVLMVGHDVEVLRDVMGYSLLSVILNQLTNADCRSKGTKIHCANGDPVTPKNENDLFNVLRSDFAPIINNVPTTAALSDCIRDVYKVYKQRAAESETSEVANSYAPEFVVIHSLQRYVDLITGNPMLRLQEPAAAAPAAAPVPAAAPNDIVAAFTTISSSGSMFKTTAAAPAATPSSMPESIAFCSALKELLDRGGKYNIHFIISVDDPLAMTAIKNELASAMFKIFVKGVSGNVMSQMLSDYKASTGLTNPKVAMVCQLDERTKVRMYRYDAAVDEGWYHEVCNNYRFLMEDMQ